MICFRSARDKLAHHLPDPSVISLAEHDPECDSHHLSPLTTSRPGWGEGPLSTYLQLEQGICKERRWFEDFKKCEKQRS